MHIVSAILRRTLLQHTPVAIEGIGTLQTIRRGAQFLPGSRLDAPRRMPELVTSDTEDISLSEIVATELSTDILTALELCRQWHNWALSGEDGSLMVLEGVGSIRIHTLEYYPDPEFLALLNPLPAEPLVIAAPIRKIATPQNGRRRPSRRRPPVRPRGKNPHNYTVSFVAILIVLAALGYLCYYLWAHTALFEGILPR